MSIQQDREALNQIRLPPFTAFGFESEARLAIGNFQKEDQIGEQCACRSNHRLGKCELLEKKHDQGK